MDEKGEATQMETDLLVNNKRSSDTLMEEDNVDGVTKRSKLSPVHISSSIAPAEVGEDQPRQAL